VEERREGRRRKKRERGVREEERGGIKKGEGKGGMDSG